MTTRQLTSKEKSDLILCHLYYIPQTTHDLADITGLDRIEVARLIHSLKTPGYVVSQEVFDQRNGETKVKHQLTPVGKKVSPDPTRYLAKHKPFAGLKHVNGVAGKFDPTKPLKGVRGRLYVACTREMTAHELSAAANVDLNAAFSQLSTMTRIGIMGVVDRTAPGSGGRRRSLYFRQMNCSVDPDILDPEDAQPEPATASQAPTQTQSIASANEVVTATTAAVSVDTDLKQLETPKPTRNVSAIVDELLTTHSWSEVMLEITIRVQERIDELQRFQDSILNRAKEVAKT